MVRPLSTWLDDRVQIVHPLVVENSIWHEQTWNVCTLENQGSDQPERRTAFVARELRRLDIVIAALQETRLADEG